MKIYVRYRASSHDGRLTSLARLAVGLVIALGTTTLVLGHFGGAEGATTTSSTTTANPFPVSTNATSYSGTTSILVSGNLTSNVVAESSVSITISTPRNVALVAQNTAVTGNDSSFSAVFQASYTLGWNVTGQYIVTVIDVIPDDVGTMPTSTVYFQYTAVQPTTTSTSSPTVATTSSITTSSPSSGTSLGAIVPLVLVIVIVVAVVGFVLRSRGRRGPRARSPPPPPAQPRTTTAP
jgi:hypothetical protein